MQHQLKRSVQLLVLGFVVGGSVQLFERAAAASSSEAFLGMTCKPNLGTSADETASYSVGANASTGTWVQNDETSTQDFVCALPDESVLSLGSLTTVSVSIYDGHSTENVTAKACGMWQDSLGVHTHVGATGDSCGFNAASSSGTGGTSLSLSLKNGTAPALENTETGYVWIRLPPKQGSSVSKIYNFWVSNG